MMFWRSDRLLLVISTFIYLFQVIKDYKLFMVVGVFLLLDIIILTTWQVVDPFYREVKRGDAVVSYTVNGAKGTRMNLLSYFEESNYFTRVYVFTTIT